MNLLDKQIIKTNFSLLGKYIVCLTMAFIVTISLFMVFSATSDGNEGPKGAANIVMLILSEVCSLGTMLLFINGTVFYIGDSDANKVQFGRIEYDKWKGLKISILPAVPGLATYIVLLLGKLGVLGNWSWTLFNLCNYHLYGYHQLIFGGRVENVQNISWLSMVGALLAVVLVPIICHVCYTLGYKRINLFERFVYKKDKRR